MVCRVTATAVQEARRRSTYRLAGIVRGVENSQALSAGSVPKAKDPIVPDGYSKSYDILSPIVRGRCTVMAGV